MKKTLAAIAAVALMGLTITACSGGAASSSSSSESSSSSAASSSSESSSSSAASGTSSFTGLSGSLTMDGSSALAPLAQVAADSLKAKNPNLSITVNAGGSGTGLKDVLKKTVDIGNSDVFANEKLPAADAATLVDHKVCIIGVATVVNPSVTVTNLTTEQLVSIFTGKVTNWKDVGGSDMPIVIVNRPSSSGTRALFKKNALNGATEATGKALSQDDSGILAQTVAQTKGAIGYLALSYTKGKTDLKLVSINGTEPTYDNIYAGKYKVWGYEHMYTNGEATGLAKTFIDYMTSSEFASNIDAKGYGDASKIKS